MIGYLGSAFTGILIGFVVGTLWYSPLMFGNQWLRLAFGPNGKPNMEMANTAYLSACLGQSVSSMTIYELLHHVTVSIRVAPDTYKLAIMLAVLVFFIRIPHYTFGNQPIGLFLIDGGFDATVVFLQVVACSYVRTALG